MNARLDANAAALNPFYTGDADPWSDAFLTVMVMLVIALAIAATIRFRSPAS